MNKDWVRRGGWVLAAVLGAGALAWAFKPRPVEVDIGTVTSGAFRKTVDEDGRTRVRDRYVVSAPLAGRLLRVELKAGAPVIRGALLATLIPSAPALLDARTERELRERVGAAEAEELRAKANAERASVALALARSELERATNLAAQGFTSKQSLERGQREVELKGREQDAARFETEAAVHHLATARAALLRLHEDAVGRGTGQQWQILAPVAGRVLRVLQESEAVVSVGTPILEIGDPRNLEVVVDVLTADAAGVAAGAPVELDLGGGAAPLNGRVRLVEPGAFTKVSALGVEEQRVNVVIDFDATPAGVQNLGDAYRVDARILVDSRSDAVIVPTSALFRGDGGWAVFVVADGRAQLRKVGIGPRSGLAAIVERGLDPGTRVIVYPGDTVRDGVRVEPRGQAKERAKGGTN
jgi:HlyD family secretion protein